MLTQQTTPRLACAHKYVPVHFLMFMHEDNIARQDFQAAHTILRHSVGNDAAAIN